MHYNFIEIGTSDIETLIESTVDQRGLCVEPIQLYLDRLPNNSLVTKVCAAISDEEGIAPVYWVHPDNIQRYGLPNWIRGCNSIEAPHPTTVRVLDEQNLSGLLQKTYCRKITWTQLVEEQNVSSVDYVKIDTEGHDWHIVSSILTGGVRPEQISFEYNTILADQNKMDTVIGHLRESGYVEFPSPKPVYDGDRFFRLSNT
jgi:hypothetical protein